MGKVIKTGSTPIEEIRELGEDLFTTHRGSRMMKLTGQLGFVTAEFKAHHASPDSKHNYRSTSYAMNIVLRGKGTYLEENGTMHTLSPGKIFHRYPGILHSTLIETESNYAEWYLVFDPVTGECLHKLGLFETHPVISVGINPVLLEELIEITATIALPASNLSSAALTVKLVTFMAGLYERAHESTVDDHWGRIVRQSCQWLEDTDNDWVDIEHLAEEVGVSYPSFRRIFKERRGIAPGEYRIRHRLDKACQLLMSRPVKEVADALGYADPFSFSAQFKKYIGSSPLQFQRSLIRLRE